MNGPAPQSYEWGLYRKSTKRSWIGLTRREMQMVVSLVAQRLPQDWLIWHITWPEWKELAEGISETKFETMRPNMKNIHVELPKKGPT